jgi:hypothetical protein
MPQAGDTLTLTLVEKSDRLAYFNAGGQLIEIDVRELPEGAEIGDTLAVSFYLNNNGKLTATTRVPKAKLHQFAKLKVKEVNAVGAFLDWGMPKDLLLPFGEQMRPVKPEQWHLVYIYRNKNDGRVVASSKIDKFLDKTPAHYKVGDQVNLIVHEPSDLGMKVIINHAHSGLIHDYDLHKKLRYGESLQGFIKHIRDDGKIDIALHKVGLAGRDELADKIVQKLKENDGVLAISDKSSPEVIAKIFGVSKKQFKTALGKLYKEQKITIEERLIKLIA